MNNDILLSRKILQWGWYKDANTFRVFLHLLLTANWKDGEYLGHKILRGQCVFGLMQVSRQTGMTVRQVRTALDHLKTTGELTIKSTNKFSIATIVKYSDYQLTVLQFDTQNGNQSGKPSTNERQTNDKPPTTSNSYKSGNSVNQYIYTLSRSEKWNEAFLAFSEMRKAIKHNLTAHAAELIVRELDKLSPDEATQIEILNQSVVHSWQGVFSLKERKLAIPSYDDSVDFLGRR